MTYTDPVQRVAFYRGNQLGTELISIFPGTERLGSEVSVDIDNDRAYVSILSPGMQFMYSVLTYLHGSTGASTPQQNLHRAFAQEMINMYLAGLKFNDLVWIDDISLHTTVTGGYGGVTGGGAPVAIPVVDVMLLDIVVGDYVWFGSASAHQGFFAEVEAINVGGDTVTVTVPDAVYTGTIIEETARKIEANYDVYKVFMGYHRCRYQGQTLPEVAEGSQDTERFAMQYMFISDSLPNFYGEVL